MQMSTVTAETRNSLHCTSTGIGHTYREPALDTTLDWGRLKPLPTVLTGPGYGGGTRALNVDDVYSTSTQLQQKEANSYNLQATPPYRRAAGHWKIHYVQDTVNKLNIKPWRRPLTMGHQTSETKWCYQGKPDSIAATLPNSSHDRLLPQILKDHHKSLTKETPPSVNVEAGGRPFVPHEQGVLDRLQPYMTSQNWFHRPFTSNELSSSYPRKDITTYWQSENYPKAWGYGNTHNPKHIVTNNWKNTGPMRDRTVFPTPTTVRRIPPSKKPATNGLQALYTDMYTPPTQENRKLLFYCPVPPTTAICKDKSLVQAVPGMYKSLNSSYGNPPGLLTST